MAPYARTGSAVCQALRVSTDADDEDEIPGIDRLLALTDGVVAIALTLLVLQLQVPVTHVLERDPRVRVGAVGLVARRRRRADELPGPTLLFPPNAPQREADYSAGPVAPI